MFSRFSLEENYAAFFLRGTLAPERRASDKPMAIACLRLVTFLPLRPLFNLPLFIAFISRSTDLPAFGLYLRLEDFLARPLDFLAALRRVDAEDLRLREEEDDERFREDVPREERLRVDFLVAAMRI